MAFSLFSYFFKRVVENMAASFKDRYRRNKETLEWYDALAMAVAVIALAFTFGVRIVKVDGHSMDPTLSNGERILINLLKKHGIRQAPRQTGHRQGRGHHRY